MKKIGIIICDRYHTCGGGKCFRALRERVGAFAPYPKEEAVEIVGFSTCGGCPGGNVESVPEEMKKNGLPVRIGTHPIPLKYFDVHRKLPFWKDLAMDELAGDLLGEDPVVMESYN